MSKSKFRPMKTNLYTASKYDLLYYVPMPLSTSKRFGFLSPTVFCEAVLLMNNITTGRVTVPER